MFKRVIEKYLHSMRDAPDHLKTQEMCEKAVEKSPYQLDDRFPFRFVFLFVSGDRIQKLFLT